MPDLPEHAAQLRGAGALWPQLLCHLPEPPLCQPAPGWSSLPFVLGGSVVGVGWWQRDHCLILSLQTCLPCCQDCIWTQRRLPSCHCGFPVGSNGGHVLSQHALTQSHQLVSSPCTQADS